LEVAAIHDIAGLSWPDITLISDSCRTRADGWQPATQCDGNE